MLIIILLMSCGWVSIRFGTMFLSINFLRVYGRKQIEISYEKNVNLGSMKTALAYPLWENTLKFSHKVATSTVHVNFPKGIIKIEIAISMRIFHIKSRIPIRH